MDREPIHVSPDDMIYIIGRQQIEIEMLRAKVAQLEAAPIAPANAPLVLTKMEDSA